MVVVVGNGTIAVCLGVWVGGVEKVARAEEGKVGGVC